MVVLDVDETRAGAGRSPPRSRRAWRPTSMVGSRLRADRDGDRRSRPDDRRRFLADLGLPETARDRFVQAAYRLLDLISFLTTGEDEVRPGRSAPARRRSRGGGKVHSDIGAASFAPRSSPTTISCATARRPSAARPASCGSRERTTSCATATSSTIGSTYERRAESRLLRRRLDARPPARIALGHLRLAEPHRRRRDTRGCDNWCTR